MADRGGHKHKITKEQRDRIVETFLEKGEQEAQSVASAYGLAPDYAAVLVRARGLK